MSFFQRTHTAVSASLCIRSDEVCEEARAQIESVEQSQLAARMASVVRSGLGDLLAEVRGLMSDMACLKAEAAVDAYREARLSTSTDP